MTFDFRFGLFGLRFHIERYRTLRGTFSWAFVRTKNHIHSVCYPPLRYFKHTIVERGHE